MPLYGPKQDAVHIQGATLVWNAITQPDKGDDGRDRWSAKIVVPPGHPDVAILQSLAQQCLNASEFKGVLPAGGRMPIGEATVHEFNGMFPGWAVINCTTYRLPQVYEEGTGRALTPMEYGAQFFTGQNVDVVVSCRSYNNIGKGIGSSLEGIAANVSKAAPQIQLGTGGMDASSAFGGQPLAAPQPPPAAPVAQPAQAHDFLPQTPPPPGPAPAGAPPPPPPPAERSYVHDGVAYTKAQLLAARWPEAAIDSLPAA